MKDVVKKIIIEGEFGKKPEKITEINYNTLPSVEILSRIRAYEAQHKTYETLASRLDCGESSFEELTALGDWELLIKERQKRVLEGKISISFDSKPISHQELTQFLRDCRNNADEYEILQNLERMGLIKNYFINS